eukprot:1405866-Amphidinium_carterae.1
MVEMLEYLCACVELMVDSGHSVHFDMPKRAPHGSGTTQSASSGRSPHGVLQRAASGPTYESRQSSDGSDVVHFEIGQQESIVPDTLPSFPRTNRRSFNGNQAVGQQRTWGSTAVGSIPQNLWPAAAIVYQSGSESDVASYRGPGYSRALGIDKSWPASVQLRDGLQEEQGAA